MGNSIFKKPFILALSAVFCAAAAKVATEEPNTQLDAFGFPVAWGPSPFVPCEVFFLKPAGCVGNGDLSEVDALQQQVENSSDHRSAEAQMALDEYARTEFKNVLNPNSLPLENMFHLFLMMTSMEGFENAGKLGMTSGQLEKVASSVIGRYLDSIQNALC